MGMMGPSHRLTQPLDAWGWCLATQVLQQEGWHYELEKKDEPLTYKGVVYNEMKGVYSSPDQIMGRVTQNVRHTTPSSDSIPHTTSFSKTTFKKISLSTLPTAFSFPPFLTRPSPLPLPFPSLRSCSRTTRTPWTAEATRWPSPT
jgi:hypothetical protein